jgi:hypothetical protein
MISALCLFFSSEHWLSARFQGELVKKNTRCSPVFQESTLHHYKWMLSPTYGPASSGPYTSSFLIAKDVYPIILDCDLHLLSVSASPGPITYPAPHPQVLCQ